MSAWLQLPDEEAWSAFDLPERGPIVVVLCHFNPCLYKRPVANLRIALSWLASERLTTYAVEVRSGGSLRAPPVLPTDNPRVLQLEASGTMFRKDNLWNIGASLVPAHFCYILWLDADVILTAPGWQESLLMSLRHNRVVQPFSKAVWLDSAGTQFKEKMSCGYGFRSGSVTPQLSHLFHSGFAIASSRTFCSETSGFYNCPIGGGSLFFMSAVTGRENELEPKLAEVCPPLLDDYRAWAQKMDKHVSRSFGYVDGEAIHLWHGSRANRRYRDRFDRLADFDPKTDIETLGPHGLHDWSAETLIQKPDLVQRVADYFIGREEDEAFLAN